MAAKLRGSAPAVVRPDITNSERPSIGEGGDPNISPVSKDELAHIKQFLGADATPMTLARVAGAPDGSMVTIDSHRYNPYVKAGYLTAWIKGPGFKAVREINETRVENVSIKIRKTGTGLGTKIFVAQVEACREVGIKRIQCYAARDTDQNGYSTWPKLGYDGPIDHNLSIPPELGSPKMVSDLMETPAGRTFWQAKGSAFFASFDTDPASQSSRVLSDYVASKSRRSMLKLSDDPQKKPSGEAENPPELTDEDEAILASIWDRIGRKSLIALAAGITEW